MTCTYVLDQFWVMGILPLVCREHPPAVIPSDLKPGEYVCAERGRFMYENKSRH